MCVGVSDYQWFTEVSGVFCHSVVIYGAFAYSEINNVEFKNHKFIRTKHKQHILWRFYDISNQPVHYAK